MANRVPLSVDEHAPMRRPRVLFSLIIALVSTYVILCLFLFLYQDRMIFFPEKGLRLSPRALHLHYEDVLLDTIDGEKVFGWFVPAEKRRATLLFFHGNAGNIADRLDSIQIFYNLGLDVLILDYPGYGKSTGEPSEEGSYHAADASWKYLIEERKVPPSQLILFGRSLGGGVASFLGAKEKPAGIILESTFTSLPARAQELYPFFPVKIFAQTHYDNLSRLGQFNAPILIAHAKEDSLIPFHHGEELYEKASEPKSFLEMRGDHNDGPFVTGQAYIDGLQRFINSVIP